MTLHRLAIVLLAGFVLLSLACVSAGTRATTRKANLTIVSAVLNRDRGGRDQMVIHIRNDDTIMGENIRIWADCYNDSGTIIASEWLPSDPYSLAPKQESVRSIRFAEGVRCARGRARVVESMK